jgi:hypothetical protein
MLVSLAGTDAGGSESLMGLQLCGGNHAVGSSDGNGQGGSHQMKWLDIN